ncbi:hypothetical protein NM688_g6256 [Phlebia brevispora]|uniref:Uncharacterized protein n=1 Tax=Phlebia brevispora TaxID=194682 RepID=A0ACC1SI44_9APHY|nr:hypothetical protein NM688_g6256 [Phlebia brevispora]
MDTSPMLRSEAQCIQAGTLISTRTPILFRRGWFARFQTMGLLWAVLDVHGAGLACNVGGDAAAGLVAEAPAGSTWPDDHLGPVSHYMASCDGDCLTFDATNAKWFKLDAAGLYSNGTRSNVVTNGLSASTVIPAELTSGEYLIRHEIIALHQARQPQFYPACAQVKVSGGGGQLPASKDLVDISGVYDDLKRRWCQRKLSSAECLFEFGSHDSCPVNFPCSGSDFHTLRVVHEGQRLVYSVFAAIFHWQMSKRPQGQATSRS